ncbi:PREDICTED: proline-rich protein HaeIII subfamily 1-like [Galeopterus variegatus]|uniref:Proline-rich protein HaeIII subfamily 1-like n=1 Tax=Galeopterus variegatus TaxID=482537 RepID=A0ABM0R3B7_GALVR|nr:PREDICTED: proline-rich protein HaeIII subfamily 1-like [Galeopterus variegatus]
MEVPALGLLSPFTQQLERRRHRDEVEDGEQKRGPASGSGARCAVAAKRPRAPRSRLEPRDPRASPGAGEQERWPRLVAAPASARAPSGGSPKPRPAWGPGGCPCTPHPPNPAPSRRLGRSSVESPVSLAPFFLPAHEAIGEQSLVAAGPGLTFSLGPRSPPPEGRATRALRAACRRLQGSVRRVSQTDGGGGPRPAPAFGPPSPSSTGLRSYSFPGCHKNFSSSREQNTRLYSRLRRLLKEDRAG